MKPLPAVCFLALTLLVLGVNRQAPGQEMRQGVSVQLAVTSNALPMPEADADPWIVSVTSSGELYFGIHPVTVDRLVEEMKARPRSREQKLYVKADERTAYANVKKALDAGRELSFEVAVLLTSQREYAAPGAIQPPKGLEVMLGPLQPGADSTLMQVHKSRRPSPEVRIGQQIVQWSVLPATLTQLLQSQKDKPVQLQASEQLPFSDVVHVIDLCRGQGAKVFLAAPEL